MTERDTTRDERQMLELIVSTGAHAVIQLDPAHCDWGPLLCIVEKVEAWGVKCYALHSGRRGEPPGCMYMRISHGHYATVGPAEWIAGS